jgi:hypothetical protein
MASVTTRTFLIFATLVSGLLAGGNVDRAFVAMPAWQQVGAITWAEFSRHADLGNGLILYPIEAIGGALLTIAAAMIVHFDGNAPRAAAVLIYAAALFAVGGLILTAKAAPTMLGIRGVSDLVVLQRAFEEFWYWGNLRAICQVSVFLLQLATLAVLLRGGEAKTSS